MDGRDSHIDETRAPAHEADATERVRALMLGYVDKVAEKLGYVRFDRSTELSNKVRELFGSNDSEAVMAEVQLSIARNPHRLANASSDTEIARELYEIFENAIRAIEERKRERALYEAADAGDLDPDPTFRAGAIRSAARDWSG